MHLRYALWAHYISLISHQPDPDLYVFKVMEGNTFRDRPVIDIPPLQLTKAVHQLTFDPEDDPAMASEAILEVREEAYQDRKARKVERRKDLQAEIDAEEIAEEAALVAAAAAAAEEEAPVEDEEAPAEEEEAPDGDVDPVEESDGPDPSEEAAEDAEIDVEIQQEMDGEEGKRGEESEDSDDEAPPQSTHKPPAETLKTPPAPCVIICIQALLHFIMRLSSCRGHQSQWPMENIEVQRNRITGTVKIIAQCSGCTRREIFDTGSGTDTNILPTAMLIRGHGQKLYSEILHVLGIAPLSNGAFSSLKTKLTVVVTEIVDSLIATNNQKVHPPVIYPSYSSPEGPLAPPGAWYPGS